jgi:hypothetical protein
MRPPAHAPEAWRAVLARDMDYAQRRLIADGSLHPLFILQTSADELVLMPAQYSSEAGKHAFQRAVTLAAIAHDARAISFMGEAWMRMVGRRSGETTAELDQRARDVPPSEAHDRVECLIVSLTWRSDDGQRRWLICCREILREPSTGAITGLAADKVRSEADGVTGGMVELLPARRPTGPERTLANALLREIGVMVEPVAPS